MTPTISNSSYKMQIAYEKKNYSLMFFFLFKHVTNN